MPEFKFFPPPMHLLVLYFFFYQQWNKVSGETDFIFFLMHIFWIEYANGTEEGKIISTWYWGISCMEYCTPALSYHTTEMWSSSNLHDKMHNNQPKKSVSCITIHYYFIVYLHGTKTGWLYFYIVRTIYIIYKKIRSLPFRYSNL